MLIMQLDIKVYALYFLNIMYMKYLKQFVIGSSYLVFAPFFYAVENNQPKKTYDYYNYTLIAPIWFGVWNVLSLILSDFLNKKGANLYHSHN